MFGTSRQQRLVAGYLAELRESIGRQVLIEAKILEVALSDEFSSGINWRAVLGDATIAAPLGIRVVPPPFNNPLQATAGVVTAAVDSGDLDVIAHFIQRFGTVRTLSSPRLTVLQNQTAVLKVAENQVFFRLNFERVERDNGDQNVNINSEIRTVPIGVIMTVQPSINRATDEISLALRPTVTRVVAVVDDPAVSIASNNTVASQIPVVAVQELEFGGHDAHRPGRGHGRPDARHRHRHRQRRAAARPAAGHRLPVQGPRREHPEDRARGVPAGDDPRRPEQHRAGRCRPLPGIRPRPPAVPDAGRQMNAARLTGVGQRIAAGRPTTGATGRPTIGAAGPTIGATGRATIGAGAALRPLVGYLLRVALGERLLVTLLAGFGASAALAVFLGSTALVEQREFAAVLVANAARLVVVLALVLVTCFQVRRAFEAGEVDLLLSRPISRSDFVLGHILTL